MESDASIRQRIREEDPRVPFLGIRDTKLVGSKSFDDQSVPLKPFVPTDDTLDPDDASVVEADGVPGVAGHRR